MAFSLIRADTGLPVTSGGVACQASNIALFPMASGTVGAILRYYWFNSGPSTSLACFIPKNPDMVLTGASVEFGTTLIDAVLDTVVHAKQRFDEAVRDGKPAALVTSVESGVIKLEFGCVPSKSTVMMKLHAIFTPRISNKELSLLIPTSSPVEFCMSGTTGGSVSVAADAGAEEWKPLISFEIDGTFPRVKSGRIDFGSLHERLTITDAEVSGGGLSRVYGAISNNAGPAIQVKLELVEHIDRPLGGYVIRPDALVVWAGGLPSSIPAPSKVEIFTLLTIFVDCSGSMSCSVGTAEGGLIINRLTMAKAAAVGVLKDVVGMNKEGVWVEVIAFGTTAFFITPTEGDTARLAVCTTNTSDMNSLMAQVALMDFDGGTELNNALELAQLGDGDNIVIGRTTEGESKRHVDVQEWIVITDGEVTGKVLPHGPLVRCSSFGIGDANEASLLAISQAPGRTTNLNARPSGGGSSATYDVDALEASISLVLGDSLNTVPCPFLKLEEVDTSAVFQLKDMPPVGKRHTVMMPLVVPIDVDMDADDKAEYVKSLLANLQLVQGEVLMPLRLTCVEDGTPEAVALCAVVAASILRNPAPTMTDEQKAKLALDCGVAAEGYTAFVMVGKGGGASIAGPGKHTVGIMRAPTIASLAADSARQARVAAAQVAADKLAADKLAASRQFAFVERRVMRGIGGGWGGGVNLGPPIEMRTTRGGGGGGWGRDVDGCFGVPEGRGATRGIGGGGGGFLLDEHVAPAPPARTTRSGWQGGEEDEFIEPPVDRSRRGGMIRGGMIRSESTFGDDAPIAPTPPTPTAPTTPTTGINIHGTPSGPVNESMSDTDLRINIKMLLKLLNASFKTNKYWLHSKKLMELCGKLSISYSVVNNVVCVDGIVEFFWGNKTASEMRVELVMA